MSISPTVLIIPTGIGCEIGGFAGDALPTAKLLASASGCLITHPNVMNGGSLSEKHKDIYYVEGYNLDRFAKCEIGLKSVNQQKRRNDLGLYTITENPSHRWLFRTPSLRNISLTAPYMHNGIFSNLDEVIEFYNQGGVKNELLSPLIKELNLSKKEKINLRLFLESLVGENINILIADALAAPVGDLTEDDPNWANKKDMGYNK